MLVEGNRVSLGTTKIDLSNYYTIEETDEKFIKKEELINTFTGTEGDKIVDEDGNPVLDEEGNEQFGQVSDGMPLSQKAIVDLYKMLKEMIGIAEVKVGTVTAFAGNTCPENYLFCRGQSLLKAEYPELFAVIGTTYGGSETSFNLPDLRGRVPVGVDPDMEVTDIFTSLNQTGGEVEHVLTTSEMPSHNHTGNTTQTIRRLSNFFDSISYSSLPSESGYILYATYQSFAYQSNSNSAFSDSTHPGKHLKTASGDSLDIRGVMVNANNSSLTINNRGGGLAHNNCQPYITLNYIIKYR
jgi:microcystin-dependent protein